MCGLHGGDSCVWVFLPEDICYRSPSIGAAVIWKEAIAPLPLGFLTKGMLLIQHCAVKLTASGFLRLLSSTDSLALPGSSRYLRVDHQTRVEIPLP